MNQVLSSERDVSHDPAVWVAVLALRGELPQSRVPDDALLVCGCGARGWVGLSDGVFPLGGWQEHEEED